MSKVFLLKVHCELRLAAGNAVAQESCCDLHVELIQSVQQHNRNYNCLLLPHPPKNTTFEAGCMLTVSTSACPDQLIFPDSISSGLSPPLLELQLPPQSFPYI